MTLLPSLLLSVAAVLSAAAAPAVAQGPVSSLESASVPMRSRTCGLVLLSNGRAKVRAKDHAAAMSELIGAFALLQDGRALDDKDAARTVSQNLLRSDATRAAVISDCQRWLGLRKNQPDFDKSEAAQWNWAQQAKLTMDTEH